MEPTQTNNIENIEINTGGKTIASVPPSKFLSFVLILVFSIIGGGGTTATLLGTKTITAPTEISKKEIEETYSSKKDTEELWRFLNRQEQILDKRIEQLATKNDIEAVKQLIQMLRENDVENRNLILKQLERQSGRSGNY